MVMGNIYMKNKVIWVNITELRLIISLSAPLFQKVDFLKRFAHQSNDLFIHITHIQHLFMITLFIIDLKQMNAMELLKHPSHRRVVGGFSLLIRNGFIQFLKDFPQPTVSYGIKCAFYS